MNFPTSVNVALFAVLGFAAFAPTQQNPPAVERTVGRVYSPPHNLLKALEREGNTVTTDFQIKRMECLMHLLDEATNLLKNAEEMMTAVEKSGSFATPKIRRETALSYLEVATMNRIAAEKTVGLFDGVEATNLGLAAAQIGVVDALAREFDAVYRLTQARAVVIDALPTGK